MGKFGDDIRSIKSAITKYKKDAPKRQKAKIAKQKNALAMERHKTAMLKEKAKQCKLRPSNSDGGMNSSFNMGNDEKRNKFKGIKIGL